MTSATEAPPPGGLARVLEEQLSAWPHPGAAAALTATGEETVAGCWEEPFAWASVTKLLVALSVWVAVEEGTLDWATPAGPPGSTVAHLLAHASGLPFEGPQPIVPPGRRRTYSNTGTEMLAECLAGAAGMPFAEYLQGAVLGPLAMEGTTLDGSPARGAGGPLADLVALARELMKPTLVSQATLDRAATVAFPGLTGVVPGFGRYNPCDWGLGPEIKGGKTPHWTGTLNSPRTFGHFGQSGSLLWVDPARSVALVSLSSKSFGPWAKSSWPALADAVLARVSSDGQAPGAGSGEVP